METYQTEEEQVEAIRRWWQENGRSTIAAIVIAVAAGVGWQQWQGYDLDRAESASIIYQNLLQSLNSAAQTGDKYEAKNLADQLKNEYGGTSYAQFAALQLAKLAVQDNKPEEALSQLRWAVSQAGAGSDVAYIAQLRLARVLASSGEAEQALTILATGKEGPYAASYAIAQGDIYLQMDRVGDARDAYAAAKMAMAQSSVEGSIASLDNKIQLLNPVPVRTIQAIDSTPVSADEPMPENQEG